MTKAAACLDSNRFWMTPLPPEKSTQTVGKSGLRPSPAVHYAQQKQRQRLLLRVFLQRVANPQQEISAELADNGHQEKDRFFSSDGGSGMFIPDPGSNIFKKEEGKTFVVLLFLWL
jgi:hypothetical protein